MQNVKITTSSFVHGHTQCEFATNEQNFTHQPHSKLFIMCHLLIPQVPRLHCVGTVCCTTFEEYATLSSFFFFFNQQMGVFHKSDKYSVCCPVFFFFIIRVIYKCNSKYLKSWSLLTLMKLTRAVTQMVLLHLM